MIYVVYITGAGKTASDTSRDYLRPALDNFNIDHVIYITSEDTDTGVVETHRKWNPALPHDSIKLPNPLYGEEDYLSTLAEVVTRVGSIYSNKPAAYDRMKVIVNGSGGTTKFTFLLADIASIVGMVFDTKLFFAVKDYKANKVIYTEKPTLDKSSLMEILNIVKSTRKDDELKIKKSNTGNS